jgi:hypothetical protein
MNNMCCARVEGLGYYIRNRDWYVLCILTETCSTARTTFRKYCWDCEYLLKRAPRKQSQAKYCEELFFDHGNLACNSLVGHSSSIEQKINKFIKENKHTYT